MSKIILTADQHIHPHSGSLSKMNTCLETVEWVYNIAREKGISTVVSLGDLFHDRERINTLAYHRTYEIISEALSDGITTYLLMGNHDMYHRESFRVHSLRPLSSVANIVVEPMSIEIEGLKADFVPFVSDPKERLKKFFPVKKRSRILFGHLAVAGGVMNLLWGTEYKKIVEPEINDEESFEPHEIETGAFEGYEKVFLGHFHSRQTIKDDRRIHYVGSPLQINFSDAMDPRGIEILDTETLEVEFLENDFAPRYFIFPYTEDLSKYNLQNSHVRLIVPSDFGNADLLDLKHDVNQKFSTASVEIITSKTEEHGTIETALEGSIIFSQNKAETLKKYLESIEIPDGLTPDLLLQIGLEMTHSN